MFCADTTNKNWQNLDLNSLLLSLNSDSFKISNHICIIDACANYILEENGRPTNLGGYVFSSGKPKNSQQFILLATKEGEKAKVNSEWRTGYFSQAVLEALEKSPSDVFPPNMKAIAESVKEHFDSLNKDQSPTYLYYRNCDGDESEVYYEDIKEGQKQNNSSMSQVNKDNVKGWQMRDNNINLFGDTHNYYNTPPQF